MPSVREWEDAGGNSEQSDQDVESLCSWAIFNMAFILSL